jgi:hypothetical protein
MPSVHQHHVRRLRVRLPAVASVLLLAAALFLWFWTAGVYYRPLPRLGFAVTALGLSGSAIASDDGVHFRVYKGYGQRVEFRWSEFNRPNYHHGLVVNLLGVIVAAQPYTYNGGDYIISPNAGFALPYWLLIVTAGYGVLRFTGLSAWLARYCRFGALAWGAMALVALIFLVLNFLPHVDHGSARTYDPSVTLSEQFQWWVQVLFDPASFGDIALYYGFPFCWIERGYMNGLPVDLYYGAEMEFRQHKLAECLAVALSTMFLCGIAVQWLSELGIKQPA